MEKKLVPVIGSSGFIREITVLSETLSAGSASVLLFGERGSGKRLIAQHIHYASARTTGCFFELHCRTFSKADCLLVFDALSQIAPMGQAATLFINTPEVLSLELQRLVLARLKELRRKNARLRLLASSESQAALEQRLDGGDFLEELYFLLKTVVLNVPPLRERREDILPIADYYLETFRKKSGLLFEGFSDGARQAMASHFWKGNVDELVNTVQRGFITGEPPVIKAADLGFGAAHEGDSGTLKEALDGFKKEYLTKVLEENSWNQTKTAQVLGIQRTYVIRLMNELQIRRQ